MEQSKSPLDPSYLTTAARAALDRAINWALIAAARGDVEPSKAWIDCGRTSFERARGLTTNSEWNAAAEYFTRRFNALWLIASRDMGLELAA